MDKYDVLHNGKWICHLNERLVAKQGISDENLAALRLTHQVRHIIFERAKKTKDGRKLKELAGLFEELEFLQQSLWGFPQDEKFHRWFDMPGCTCPKLDNADNIGTGLRITVEDCPIHGFKKPKTYNVLSKEARALGKRIAKDPAERAKLIKHLEK